MGQLRHPFLGPGRAALEDSVPAALGSGRGCLCVPGTREPITGGGAATSPPTWGPSQIRGAPSPPPALPFWVCRRLKLSRVECTWLPSRAGSQPEAGEDAARAGGPFRRTGPVPQQSHQAGSSPEGTASWYLAGDTQPPVGRAGAHTEGSRRASRAAGGITASGVHLCAHPRDHCPLPTSPPRRTCGPSGWRSSREASWKGAAGEG